MAILTAGLLSTTYAYAQGAPGDSSVMVQKIADRFGLKKEEVQAVFDQEHANRKVEMGKKFEEKLTQAVKDGRITEAQKTLILAKHTELQTSREANREKFKSMTDSERKAAMESERKALEEWATKNKIDVKYLMGFAMGMKGHRMMK